VTYVTYVTRETSIFYLFDDRFDELRRFSSPDENSHARYKRSSEWVSRYQREIFIHLITPIIFRSCFTGHYDQRQAANVRKKITPPSRRNATPSGRSFRNGAWRVSPTSIMWRDRERQAHIPQSQFSPSTVWMSCRFVSRRILITGSIISRPRSNIRVSFCPVALEIFQVWCLDRAGRGAGDHRKSTFCVWMLTIKACHLGRSIVQFIFGAKWKRSLHADHSRYYFRGK